jgi:serine/threonine-protein kinase ULK/ATG1
VPSDVKTLTRVLLKQNPAERASFEEFFGSAALARSKFPRQSSTASPAGSSADVAGSNLSSINHSPLRPPRVLEPEGEGSIIPGETEEDEILNEILREYVLVGDGRAVEFNRAVGELSAVPRRPLHDRRIPSSATPTPTPGEEYPDAPSPHTNLTANRNGNGNHTSFPPPQHPGAMPPPPLSSSSSSITSRAASNALNRALGLASKKLFDAAGRRSSASRYSHESLPPPPPRANIALGDGDGGEREKDLLEDELLMGLEQLAQKTFVLTHWADELYEDVKAVQHSAFSSFLRSLLILLSNFLLPPSLFPTSMLFRRSAFTD